MDKSSEFTLGKKLAFSLTFAVLASTAAAQALSPGEVRLSSHPYELRSIIRAETALVQLEVVVRDTRGRVITNLSKDDFAVYDSGKLRDVTAFSADIHNVNPSTSFNPPSAANQSVVSPPPSPQTMAPPASSSTGRWIALLFDDLNTPAGDLSHAKIASNRFVREALASGDRIAIFTTSAGAIIEFTSDPSAALASIATIQAHPRMSPNGISQCPRMSPFEAYQIVNNDGTAMKVKIAELCRCGAADDSNGLCLNVEAMPPNSVLSTTLGKGSGAEIIESVKAQAQQTWDLAHLVAQTTLKAIKGDLDALSRKPGRRMLLLASSGFLSGALEQQQDAIVNEAVRAGVVINSLDAKGLYTEAPAGPLNETNELAEIPVSSTVFQVESLGDRLDSVDSAMARFAESTGGLFFRNNNDLDLGFYRLGVLPECTYLLDFAPANDGKYHKIRVELKNAKHPLLQVRPGYFAPAKTSTEPPSPANTIEAEVRGSDEKVDVPANSIETIGAARSEGLQQLTIKTHVDIEKLPFQEQKDRHVQKLTFVAALFDSRGNFITGKEAEMEFALKLENFERFSKTGINGVMQLDVSPGAYRLRVVVQEALRGRISATSKDLQVP